MRITYIYGVWDLDTQKFAYIGKSNKPLIRFKDHMKKSANLYLRELVKEKGVGSFELFILEKTSFFKSRDWVKRERFWVKKFRKEGHPLCNKNDGGGGVTEHTDEARAEMSRTRSGENHPMYGKHHSREANQKNSKSNSGKNNPNYGKFGKDHPSYGHKDSKETRAKKSKAKTGKNNPIYGTHRTEKTKAKLSKASKGNEYSAKSYPAFYNIKTNEFIPAGSNLKKMCMKQSLNYTVMFNVKTGLTKRSHNGWRLANANR